MRFAQERRRRARPGGDRKRTNDGALRDRTHGWRGDRHDHRRFPRDRRLRSGLRRGARASQGVEDRARRAHRRRDARARRDPQGQLAAAAHQYRSKGAADVAALSSGLGSEKPLLQVLQGPLQRVNHRRYPRRRDLDRPVTSDAKLVARPNRRADGRSVGGDREDHPVLLLDDAADAQPPLRHGLDHRAQLLVRLDVGLRLGRDPGDGPAELVEERGRSSDHRADQGCRHANDEQHDDDADHELRGPTRDEPYRSPHRAPPRLVPSAPSLALFLPGISRNSVCSVVGKRKEQGGVMAELDTEDREKLDKRTFAYVDKNGEGHLPLNDESHVRNAMARWNQTEFESESAKEAARRKIAAAAKRHGIEIGPDDKIAKPTGGLRAATTKRGPRGGKKTVRAKRPTSTRQRTAARRNVKKAQAARHRR